MQTLRVGCVWVCLLAVLVSGGWWFLLAQQGGEPEVINVELVPVEGILGPPTLTAAFVDRVLEAVDSPAKGKGQALYQGSRTYGIDVAFALAFFQHESTFGKAGVARETMSLGNIRCSAGYECVDTGTNGKFRKYPSWEAGFEDWYRLMLYGYVRGEVSRACPCKTLEEIIPVYAPAADKNNEGAYIRSVYVAVDRWRDGQI